MAEWQLRSRQGNLVSQTAQDAKIQATESYPKATAKTCLQQVSDHGCY